MNPARPPSTSPYTPPAFLRPAVLSALAHVAPLTLTDLRFITDYDGPGMRTLIAALMRERVIVAVWATPRQRQRADSHALKYAYELRGRR